MAVVWDYAVRLVCSIAKGQRFFRARFRSRRWGFLMVGVAGFLGRASLLKKGPKMAVKASFCRYCGRLMDVSDVF